MESSFSAYVVRKEGDGPAKGSIETVSLDDLPAGDVVLRVVCSSLNYKDAMAATGHPGVARRLPHVPGIDASGVVESCESGRFQPGDQVLVTGYELGSGCWGGYSQYIRVPEAWVVPLPDGLTLDSAMVYGTAGFTAAQAVTAILDRGIDPSRGEVAVTGATGGVGSIAVAILGKLGFRVAAVTGKPAAEKLLNQLGASSVISREEVSDTSNRPLLSARFAAAVDTVGGTTLGTLLRSVDHRGCVAACGLVGGTDIPMTVFPFILRGVSLAGIDSAMCPMPERLEMWAKLAGAWKLDQLDQLAKTVPLDELDGEVQRILAGQVTGRVVVEVGGKQV